MPSTTFVRCALRGKTANPRLRLVVMFATRYRPTVPNTSHHCIAGYLPLVSPVFWPRRLVNRPTCPTWRPSTSGALLIFVRQWTSGGCGIKCARIGTNQRLKQFHDSTICEAQRKYCALHAAWGVNRNVPTKCRIAPGHMQLRATQNNRSCRLQLSHLFRFCYFFFEPLTFFEIFLGGRPCGCPTPAPNSNNREASGGGRRGSRKAGWLSYRTTSVQCHIFGVNLLWVGVIGGGGGGK